MVVQLPGAAFESFGLHDLWLLATQTRAPADLHDLAPKTRPGRNVDPAQPGPATRSADRCRNGAHRNHQHRRIRLDLVRFSEDHGLGRDTARRQHRRLIAHVMVESIAVETGVDDVHGTIDT